MSDHHHHSHNRSSYFKDPYGSSGSGSKRYHSPNDIGRGGNMGGGYYDSSSKRGRSDTYMSGSSFHTSSASSRYNDYGSSSSLMSNRYKPSSYYEAQGLKPSSSSSKYVDDYKGSSASRSTMKSSVRRIPPPLTPPSLSSKPMMKSSLGSSSSRPLPLMKVSLSSMGSSSGRDGYGGSRLRTAPPEHHSTSYSAYSTSSINRKPEFKRPRALGVMRNSYGPTYTKTSSTVSAFRRGTIRAAATVTNKIRRRAVVPAFDERRRQRIESYASKRDDKRFEKRKIKEEPKDRKSKDSDSKGHESGIEKEKEKIKVELPDGEVGVVLDEVGGDSDEEDNDNVDGEEKGEIQDSSRADKVKIEKIDEEDEERATSKTEKGEKMESESGQDDDESHKDGREKEKRRSREERDASPSSRALLKLYCKYCDVRHVTFREYSQHLRSFPHTRAMNTSVTDMRKQLSQLRNKQRDDQRRVEKEEKVLSDTTSYCRVCELNFRTDPKEHEANELHNDIKTLIYQRCDICDIDFRIWKVYLYHMAALEHVKRVAMKELKEAEAKGDSVKGTNLSQEELGADLVEIRTVFFCNACVRYLPIKGEIEESKGRHCLTLSHVKGVEEFRQREKRIAERQRIRMEREEKEKERKLKEKVKEESEKEEKTGEGTEVKNQEKSESKGPNDDNIENVVENDPGAGGLLLDTDAQMITEKLDYQNLVADAADENNDDQDVDEDEIELHAGDDVVEDEESEDTNSGWNRRTRSAKTSN